MNAPFQLLNPKALLMLWLPAVALAAGIYGIIKSKKILSGFFAQSEKSLTGRKTLLLILLTISMFAAVFASARPSWGQKEIKISRKGRDVVFVIDVSQSMLAEDLYPDRLSRAKLAVIDALSAIDGDRVGLVAFAGTAVVKCPLTLDYSFFKQSVEELSTESVSVGGSMIGDALRKTLDDVFKGATGGYKDIILITDGEDHESYPLKAADKLGEAGVRLIAIGLGDENQGKRIPVTDENGKKIFLTYKGQEIWSRLDADTLRKMTAATKGGRYLNVSTGAFDMGEIYGSLIKTQEKRFIEDQKTVEYDENFQYFLLPAVILLLLYLFIRYSYQQQRGRK
ncbi:MAG: VWA domain-containing protein [Spirochaetales bacterium]|nr:VWA domain-containing protein [Spirochaetales bacterium]